MRFEVTCITLWSFWIETTVDTIGAKIARSKHHCHWHKYHNKIMIITGGITLVDKSYISCMFMSILLYYALLWGNFRMGLNSCKNPVSWDQHESLWRVAFLFLFVVTPQGNSLFPYNKPGRYTQKRLGFIKWGLGFFWDRFHHFTKILFGVFQWFFCIINLILYW